MPKQLTPRKGHMCSRCWQAKYLLILLGLGVISKHWCCTIGTDEFVGPSGWPLQLYMESFYVIIFISLSPCITSGQLVISKVVVWGQIKRFDLGHSSILIFWYGLHCVVNSDRNCSTNTPLETYSLCAAIYIYIELIIQLARTWVIWNQLS